MRSTFDVHTALFFCNGVPLCIGNSYGTNVWPVQFQFSISGPCVPCAEIQYDCRVGGKEDLWALGCMVRVLCKPSFGEFVFSLVDMCLFALRWAFRQTKRSKIPSVTGVQLNKQYNLFFSVPCHPSPVDCPWRPTGQEHSDPSPGATARPPPRQGVHDQNKEEKGAWTLTTPLSKCAWE